MPSPSSHAGALRPSPLLALVCAAIVRLYDPTWLSRPVSALAKEAKVRPERVSRLYRKLIRPMERLLSRFATRGRKRKQRGPGEKQRLRDQADALLSVAGEILRRGGTRRARTKAYVVAARDRLKKELGISHEKFCETLGLKERTVRSWAEKGVPAPEEPKPDPEKPRKRPRGVGRFDLALTLPGLQVVADTTNLRVFGVPLKVVACQDPGARHLTPWASFLVESEENHEIVLDALDAAIGDRDGMQVIVDQGTPYIAEAVQDACEKLDRLHEPQKEGAPTEKAPKERQFGVVKHWLGPILDLTDKIAQTIPALSNVDLARATGRLLLGTYLRVYVAAAAARETNRPDDPTVLEEVAKAQRESAVATNRSRKLLLLAIFDRYRFEGSKQSFLRVHRHHQLEDILEAEARFAKAAISGKITHWAAYFSAILVNVERERSEARRRAATRRRREAKERAQREKEKRDAAAWRQRLEKDPEYRLTQGLRIISAHYQAHLDRLWNDGVGPGRREARAALQALHAESGAAAIDRIEIAWRNFMESAEEPRAVPHVRRILDELLAAAREKARPGERDTGTLRTGSNQQNRPRSPPQH